MHVSCGEGGALRLKKTEEELNEWRVQSKMSKREILTNIITIIIIGKWDYCHSFAGATHLADLQSYPLGLEMYTG